MNLTEQLLSDILDELRSGRGGGSGGGGGGASAAAGFNPLSIALRTAGTAFGIATGAVSTLGKVASIAATSVLNLGRAAESGNAGLNSLASTVSSFLPRSLGVFGTALELAASIAEKNLSTQQSLGQSGANFTGSLTAMRSAAAMSYLSLDQFAGAVSKNSDIFRTLGGNVQEGVNQFARIQKTLLRPGSETAGMLATMGISAEEAASLTASYMRSQGSMNKQGLKDTQAVSAAVATYASELTVLSQLTGKSRKELQDKLDAEMAEAQFEAFLSTLDKAQADKLRQGISTAMLQGGQGAVDAFKAMAMGFPPMTEAGRLYVATQEAGVASLETMNAAAKDATISADKAREINRNSLAKAIVDGANDMNKMREVLQAGGLTGSALARTLADAQKLQTSFMKDGKMMSEQEVRAKLKEMDEKARVAKSESTIVQNQQRAWQEFTNTILAKINPGLTALLGVASRFMTALGPVFTDLADFFTKFMVTAKDPMDQFVNFIKEVLVPKIKDIIQWFSNTFTYLAQSKDMKEFGSRLTEKFTEGVSKIWDAIKGPIIKMWDETVKPALVSMLEKTLDYIIATLRKSKFFAFFLGETEEEKQAKNTEEAQQKIKDLTDSIARAQQVIDKSNERMIQLRSEGKSTKREEIAVEAAEKRKKLMEENLAEAQRQLAELKKPKSDDKVPSPPAAPEPTPAKRAGGSLAATGKLIENFGSGTPAILHGKEGVVTEDQMNQIISGAAQIGQVNASGNSTEGLEKITSMLSSALQQLAVLMKENNEYTKRNLDATRELNGNLWG
jgi:hypothetical protein